MISIWVSIILSWHNWYWYYR